MVRLSSKSHWDVPVAVGGRAIRVLASHPTPPTFDGVEDRNGRRNHDEIRFWADYITPGQGRYIYDDEGERGGLSPSQSFVIVGDQNADPLDGDSVDAAIDQLLAATTAWCGSTSTSPAPGGELPARGPRGIALGGPPATSAYFSLKFAVREEPSCVVIVTMKQAPGFFGVCQFCMYWPAEGS